MPETRCVLYIIRENGFIGSLNSDGICLGSFARCAGDAGGGV